MINIPNNTEVFASAVIPDERRMEQIANDRKHPLRLYTSVVLNDLFQMNNYYVEDPEAIFIKKVEAGLLIASIEN